MATWQVALVREQGVNFGVVVVQDRVLDNPTECDELCRWWALHLGCPVVLMAGRRHSTYGRRDIVGWLATINPSRLPWRQMTIAA